MSQAGSIGSGGGGGGVIQTIAGDIGSITGANVTIYANNASGVNNSGSTVLFNNSGTVSTLKLSDASNNTMLGQQAGSSVMSGIHNTGLGFHASGGITTGHDNTAIGHQSLGNIAAGNYNVAVGTGALTSVISGDHNTAVGYSSGNFPAAASSDNILIGYQAGNGLTSVTGQSNNILIGNAGTNTDANVIRIGTAGGGAGQQSTAFLAGVTGVTAAGSPVAVSSTGQLSDLGFGTAAQVLTSNGAGVSPTWQAAGGGGGSSVYFSAYLSATASNVTGDGTFYPIIFDTELVDAGGGYNNATGVFTAPSNGFYAFSYIVAYADLTATSILITEFNGSVYEIRSYMDVSTGAATSAVYIDSASWQIPMTAGDTMYITAIAFGGTKTVDIAGAALTPGTNPVSSTFSGYKIA